MAIKKTFTLSVPDFHNWKTTVAGASAALTFLLAHKAEFSVPHPDVVHCGFLVIIAGSVFLIGMLSHDAGTPSQSTLEAVAAMLASAQVQVVPPVPPAAPSPANTLVINPTDPLPAPGQLP